MLDVLVAKIACGFSFGSSSAYSACLAAAFSTMASMIRSASRSAVAFHIHLQPRQRGRSGRRVLEALLEERLRALERRLNQLFGPVLQRHRHAAISRPGGNIPAHHAGADHMHMLEFGRGFCPQTLEAILQQKHAHQIARSRRAHEFADGASLGFVSRRSGAAVSPPQIEDGVGSGVVFAPHAVLQGRRGLPRKQWAHGTQDSGSWSTKDADFLGGARSSSCLARAASWSRGTSSSSRPTCKARAALKGRPLSMSSSAARAPISCTLRTVPPNPG